MNRRGVTGLHEVQPLRVIYTGRLMLILLLIPHHRRYKARLNPPSPTESDKPSPHVPTGPKKDYSLKEGQTFSISIPGREKKTDHQSTSGLLGGISDLLGGATNTSGGSTNSGSSGGAVPLLPPPPSAPRRR